MGVSAPQYMSDPDYYAKKLQREQAKARQLEGTGHEASAGDYYLSAAEHGNEPPGFWTGKAAERIGLAGEVNADQMIALYSHGQHNGQQIGRDVTSQYDQRVAKAKDKARELAASEGPYTTKARERELRDELLAKVKPGNCLVEMTYTARKSVSLMHAASLASAKAAADKGDLATAAIHQAMADNIAAIVADAGRQIVAEAERTGAVVRTGYHSKYTGQWRDGDGLVATVWPQMTNREGEPHLHAHAVIYNGAQRADGQDAKWRALDGDSIERAWMRISAVVQQTVDQKLCDLGLPMLAMGDGNGAEVQGIDRKTVEAFSSRAVQITPKLQEMIEQYTRDRGHEPDQHAIWSMKQGINHATRKDKPEHEPPIEQLLADWAQHSREHEVQLLTAIPAAVEKARKAHVKQEMPDRDTMIQAAMASVQQMHSAWHPSHLAWEVKRQLPADLGVSPDEVRSVIDSMTADALAGAAGTDPVPLVPAVELVPVPGDVRASDGQSVRTKRNATLYATSQQLDMERWLLKAAGRQAGHVLTDREATEALRDLDLTAEQAQVAHGMLTSQRSVQCLVGMAGAGKTRVTGAVAQVWAERTGGRVIGLTTSTSAARVMQGQGVTESYNIAQFLTNGPQLRPGDRVIVDEGSMVATSNLAAIMQKAHTAGARVDIAGDTAQLDSPEAGGGFRMMVGEHGAWKLEEILRFKDEWERDASARVRSGDPQSLASTRHMAGFAAAAATRCARRLLTTG